MAKVSSADFGVLLVDGYNLLAAKVKGFEETIEVELEPGEGLGDSWREHDPTGLRKGSIAITGAFFRTETAGIHDAFKAAGTPVRLVAWAIAGNTIGALFTAVQGAYTIGYAVLNPGVKLTKANVKHEVSGAVDDGVIVQSAVAKTADWNTKTDGASVDYTLDPSQRVIPITGNTLANPSVVTTPVPHGLATGDIILIAGVITSTPTINGERTVTVISPTTFSVPVNVTIAGTGGSFVRSNSGAGGVGYQIVSAFSGFTGFVGKLRDSADDVTYADLITFANVTAGQNAQRVEVAGVVDRYLSFDGNVTGAGTLTPFVGFKRNGS